MRLRGAVIAALGCALLGCDPEARPPQNPDAPLVSASTNQQASALTDASATPGPPATPSGIPDVPAPPEPSPPIELARGGKAAVLGRAGMATSVEANATKTAIAVLDRGGNAVDAAVAAAFVLAVTHPSAGNLGGGGFMLIQRKNGEKIAIDFREAGPAATSTAKVKAEIEAGGIGWASTAVPGTVAGLCLAREKFGSLPLAELVTPAETLAQKGHKLSPRAARSLKSQWAKLKQDPEGKKIFGQGGKPLEAGDRLVQKDLARTLGRIREQGAKGFYAGETAQLIDAAMKQGGGDVTNEDLAAYQAKLRTPLSFRFRGFDVITMPPPSMGGIAVAETLLLWERLEGHKQPFDSAGSRHLFVEAAKRAYADRRSVGGDPDFFGNRLPEGAVAARLKAPHLLKHPVLTSQATPASQLGATGAAPAESPETTHLSVIDREGNAVSLTITLSASFGAKVIPKGTGVLLSNALGAFSESGVNEAAPKKHMASSMSPTILSRGGNVEIVIGSPGGDTIPNIVSQTIVNLVDYQLPLDRAVAAGRVHHQLLPDRIRFESQKDLDAKAKKQLEAMGHTLFPSSIPLGDIKAIVVHVPSGDRFAVSDPREGGLAAAQKTPAISTK